MKAGFTKKCLLSLFLVFAGAMFTFAQKIPEINGREIVLLPAKNLETALESASKSRPIFIYAQFSQSVEKAQWENKSFQILDYLGGNLYLLKIFSPFSEKTCVIPIVGWTAVLETDKISPYFQNSSKFTSSEKVQVIISFYSVFDKTSLTKLVAQVDGTLLLEQKWSSQNKWIIELPFDKLLALAALQDVRYISAAFNDVPLDNRTNSIANAYEAKASTGIWNLSGDSLTLGIGDQNYPLHIDFNDRMNCFNPLIVGDHGSFTTGIMAGAGIKDQTKEGVASKAKIFSCFFSNIIAYGAQYEAEFNIKATNNSYAAIVGDCNYAGTYDATSQFVDQLAIDRPQLLNIFAAGNDGASQCGLFPVQFGTTVGAYQAAKNSLVVGSIMNDKTISSFSGSGPVKDGRVKPEIVALGSFVNSCTYSDNYANASGTSSATPVVTGAAGLLQQRYKQLHSGQYPTSSLLKAILMNGASDLGNSGPDFKYGFGSLNVVRSLEIVDKNRYFTGSVSNGGTQAFNISVPSNLGQLKVMLYWNDQPASPASAKALVNDLDLTMVSPSSSTLLPFILNANPADVNQNAVSGVDRLNNVEQIVVDNPSAGNFAVTVNGFNVPLGSQDFVVVYSFIDKDIHITFPSKDIKLEPGFTTPIYWDAFGNTGDFTVEYSIDSGASWTFISTVPATQRHAFFTPPNSTMAENCLVKVSRTGNSAVSELFSLIGRPSISLASSQCPGSIQIDWNPIVGASKYYIYKKVEAEMKIIDSTVLTTYTLAGLNQDSVYWMAIAAGLNKGKSLRSVAVTSKPNFGDCYNVTIHGDLSINKINNPRGGRKLTSSVFGTNETLLVNVRNNDNIVANSLSILYRENGGSWTTFTPVAPAIPAAGQAVISIPGFDWSLVGTYAVDVVVKNLAIVDPVAINDTFKVVFRQLANPIMNLATNYLEGFETVPNLTSNSSIFGLTNADRFDFSNTKPEGRIRTYVQNSILIDGSKSLSFDNDYYKSNLTDASVNRLVGTFNLSSYAATTDEVRAEFDYKLHGIPAYDTTNIVFVRGNDTDPWIALQHFDTFDIGLKKRYGAFSLRDALSSQGQVLSSSTQIRINQNDHTLIGGDNFGSGLTLDNFRLFIAENDIALVKALNIKRFNCGLNNAVPLTVRVGNTMASTHNNIPIFYQVDNQAIVSETIASISAKDTISYLFAQTMDLSAPGAHTVKVWIHYTGDNYSSNDTIKSIKINNQPFVSTFPYLEGFEHNDGYYFSEGTNDSWAYGTPSSVSVHHAANGTKAWKTGITSTYNSNEVSYLYSPCFDLSGLTNPMLSFSLLYEIETPSSPTEVFDSAYMEFSIDGGLSWNRLGQMGQGFNWYNYANNYWSGTNNNYWKVSSIPLPKQSNVSLRWALFSDPGSEFAGLAIDDIHIFDYINPIYDKDSFAVAATYALNTKWNVLDGTEITAIIDPTVYNFGNSNLQSYKHSDFISPDSQQFFIPRSFALKSPGYAGSDSLSMMLFVKDSMMNEIRQSTTCASCTSHPKEVYQLGVTTYTNAANPGTVNNKLIDDIGVTLGYINRDNVEWIPYNNGYYAKFKTNQIGEYWFNDGGITQSNPLPLPTLNFTASHQGANDAIIQWKNSEDLKTLSYDLERDNGTGFRTIYSVNSTQDIQKTYSFVDQVSLPYQPFALYRLRFSTVDGQKFYSPIRKLSWDNLASSFNVYPNPTRDGVLCLKWYNIGEGNFTWTVTSIIGQQIGSGKVEQNKFSGIESISLKNAAKIGEMYVLKIYFGDTEKEFKFIYQP